MSFAVLVLAAFVSTFLTAYLARWIAGYFVAQDVTSIAAFSFVLGGGSLVTLNIGVGASEATQNAAFGLGTIAALIVIWYLFFKREAAHG